MIPNTNLNSNTQWERILGEIPSAEVLFGYLSEFLIGHKIPIEAMEGKTHEYFVCALERAKVLLDLYGDLMDRPFSPEFIEAILREICKRVVTSDLEVYRAETGKLWYSYIEWKESRARFEKLGDKLG
jgi:hypothetical protein